MGLISLSVFAGKVEAATLVVNSPADSGLGTLRQAIADAAPGDTINFNPALNGKLIRLTSQYTIAKDLTIDASALPNGIVISGDADASHSPTAGDTRIFNIGIDATVVLRNLFMQDGKTEDAPLELFGIAGDSRSGGGIYNAGTLTLEDCTVTNCRTGKGGGAISDGEPVGGDSGSGGGIYSDGTLTLIRTTISNNRTGNGGDGDGNGNSINIDGGYGGDGGGIHCDYGVMTVIDSRIVNNTCGNGGRAFNGASGADYYFPPGGEGGGIRSIGSETTIRNSLIAGNVTGVDLKYNSARPGGGISAANDGSLLVVNSTITGNMTPGSDRPLGWGGGGVFIFLTSTQFVNCTIVGNTTAGQGGGIFPAGSTVSILNTIVSGNTAAGIGNDLRFSIADLGGNFVGDPVGVTGLGTPLTGDPMLGTLADNGGPTETILPLEGAPVIDAGIVTADTPDIDQRGFARPWGPQIDIGAAEFGPMPPEPVFEGIPPRIRAPRHVIFRREPVKLRVSVAGDTTGLTFDADASGGAQTRVKGSNPFRVQVSRIRGRTSRVRFIAENESGLQDTAVTVLRRKSRLSGGSIGLKPPNLNR